VTVLAPEHPVQWVTASPVWGDAVQGGLRDATPDEETRMQQPVILRFASDHYMDDLAALLADDPTTLKNYEAQPISFRGRPPIAPADWSATPATLKLYTPIHGDFNLVAATLVCRLPGLPEHLVHPEVRERVGFVLRRVDATTGGELAWANKQWVAVDDTDPPQLADGEDVQPMFPVGYDDGGRKRKIYVGLIPTDSREPGKNSGATALPPPAGAASVQDPRLDTLDLKVIEPLKALKAPPQRPDGMSDADWSDAKTAMGTGRQDASRFLLLDFAEFLQTTMPDLWARVAAGASAPPGATNFERKLHEERADSGLSWADALRSASLQAAAIQAGTSSLAVDLQNSTSDPKALHGYVALALPVSAQPSGATPSTPGPESANVPKLDPTAATLYRIRCVYLRPECKALCPPLLSEPTVDFQIAGFFDPDAPARPVQIALPIDPKDLRGSAKNVSVLLSDAMRQQVSRAADLSSLMKGSVASGQPFDVGLVCSFSIPIITICALILLMIIVNLLNIVFWWMPYFRICFPIGLKAGSTP